MENSLGIKEDKHNGIVLNRMYAGSYLLTDLGHEVINFYQADNGFHYLYLNALGSFSSEHEQRVRDMLFVKYSRKDEFEVVGMARGLKDVYKSLNENKAKKDNEKHNGIIKKSQLEFINEQPGGVKYGGVSITEIFKDYKQQSIYITYTAEAVYRPIGDKRIYIRFGIDNERVENDGAEVVVKVIKNVNQATTSLKQYFYKKDNEEDYNTLKYLMEDKSLWRKHEEKASILKNDSAHTISLFDICKICYDENVFSNALAYFIKQYPELWIDYFKNYQGVDIAFDSDIDVEREKNIRTKYNNLSGRIDILISTSDGRIVIENKIKSGINSTQIDRKTDTDQLERYYKYIQGLNKNGSIPKSYFFILAPEYNQPKIEGKMKDIYKVISYKEIYDSLEKEGKNELENDVNFNAFFDAMKRHTYKNINEYLYEEMQHTFYSQIRKSLKANAKVKEESC